VQRPGKIAFRCPCCGAVCEAAPKYAGLPYSCFECGTPGNFPWVIDKGITLPVVAEASGDVDQTPQISVPRTSFPCPQCRRRLGHDPDLGGLFVLCPYCGEQFEMPKSCYAQPMTLFGLPGPTLTLQGIRKRIREAEKDFYVYAMCRPNGEPFYVGKGIGERATAHEAESLKAKNDRLKHRIIRSIKEQGLRVGYKLLGTFASEEEALDEEKRLIRKYGREDIGSGTLANLTDGGEGYVEKYFSEKWDTDANGVRMLENVGTPSDRSLAAPRFRCLDDVIWGEGLSEDGQRWIKAWKKPEEWTGPEMPLVAQWQGDGLTVQVFFSPNSDEHNIQAWMSQPWRDKKAPTPVVFRVFDGDRKILEDRSAFFLDWFSVELCRSRPIQPSQTRLVAEKKLVAKILHRLADMGQKLEGAPSVARKSGRAVFDAHYGTKRFSKRLQTWLKYNCNSLRLIANNLETRPS